MAEPKYTADEAIKNVRALSKYELLDRVEHAIACATSLAADYEQMAAVCQAKADREEKYSYKYEAHREEAYRLQGMVNAYRFGVNLLAEGFEERHARWTAEAKESPESEVVDSEGGQCG